MSRGSSVHRGGVKEVAIGVDGACVCFKGHTHMLSPASLSVKSNRVIELTKEEEVERETLSLQAGFS